MRLRPLALNLLLLLGSVLVAVVGLEVTLRTVPSILPEEARLRLHWRRMRDADTAQTIADPYVGFLYSANSQAELTRTDLRFSYHMDSHGFRNREPWPSQAEIVVVGDSWVFGYGVDDGQTWPSLLERNFLRSRVMNLGLSGFAPQQYTRTYETVGIPLHPKLLLYGLFPGNDLEDGRKFEQWLEQGAPGNYNLWRTADRIRELDTPLLGRSYLALLVRETWANRRARFGGRTVTWADGHKLLLTADMYAAAARRAHPGDPDFERVLAAIERAQTLAASQGTHMVVLLFPTKEEIYLPLVGKPAPEPLPPFRTELERRGIDYIDLSGAFTRQARAGRSIYFEVDGHPNQAGYRLIAQTVADYLEQQSAELQIDDWRPGALPSGNTQ